MEYNNLEEVKSKVILGIFNDSAEEFEIKDGPCIHKGAFALRPLLPLPGSDQKGSDKTSFYVIGKEIMEYLAMDEKEILALARKNSMERYPGEMKVISDFMNLSDQMLVPDGVVIPQIYVLTNNSYCCGAAALFYQPELLQNLSELTGKDLAVFPANTNCVYCVPVNNVDQLREYQEMYQTAIKGTTEEVLLADVLHYDSVKKALKQLDGTIIDQEQTESKMHVRSSGR